MVEFAGTQSGYGNIVIVNHRNNQQTAYAHLSRIDVKVGQSLTQGQTVGAVGSTGWATGPHLHFEFRVNGEYQDPTTIAQAGWRRADHRGRAAGLRAPVRCHAHRAGGGLLRRPGQRRLAHCLPRRSMAEELFIGLMSGTSLDGVDGVLADFSGGRIAVRAHASAPFPVSLRAELLALNTLGGDNELHRAALAGNGLARIYAGVVQQLLADTGTTAEAVTAIGAHGQTVRHRPRRVRRRRLHAADQQPVAARRADGHRRGGRFPQPRPRGRRPGRAAGAGLSSGAVRARRPGRRRTEHRRHLQSERCCRPAAARSLGFDCGPGNALMDHWCQSHIGPALRRTPANGPPAAACCRDLLARLLGRRVLRQDAAQEHRTGPVQSDLAGRAPAAPRRPARPTCRRRWPS